MNKIIYLIVDRLTGCIYCTTPLIVVANAICMSLGGDAKIQRIAPNTVSTKDYDIITSINSSQVAYQLSKKGLTLTKIRIDELNNDWFNTREIVYRRLELFKFWEGFALAALDSISKYHWGEFYSMACNELRNCDPANNQYTRVFEEYARILEVPEDIAYKELKLTTETDTLAKFRISAMSEKWRRKINLVSTQKQSQALLLQMTQEFLDNANI